MPKQPSPEDFQRIWNESATNLVHLAIADLDKILASRNLLPIIGEGRRMMAHVMHNLAREAMSHMAKINSQGYDISSAYIRTEVPPQQEPPSPV